VAPRKGLRCYRSSSTTPDNLAVPATRVSSANPRLVTRHVRACSGLVAKTARHESEKVAKSTALIGDRDKSRRRNNRNASFSAWRGLWVGRRIWLLLVVEELGHGSFRRCEPAGKGASSPCLPIRNMGLGQLLTDMRRANPLVHSPDKDPWRFDRPRYAPERCPSPPRRRQSTRANCGPRTFSKRVLRGLASSHPSFRSFLSLALRVCQVVQEGDAGYWGAL
jgi:hypothetical protein